MNVNPGSLAELISIRTDFGPAHSKRKLSLLKEISIPSLKSKKNFQSFYEMLCFLIAYPDNEAIYTLAKNKIIELSAYLGQRNRGTGSLYNSAVPGTRLCASFSFEIVKWLNQQFRKQVNLGSLETDDSQIQSILSVVMPKVESEIMQDANEDWKSWFKKTNLKRQDTFQRLISIFDQTDLRPEVKDELWNGLGVDVEIDIPPLLLSETLVRPFYHSGLIKSDAETSHEKFICERVRLSPEHAQQIIDCSRMVLVQNFREIDPLTFTSPEFVSYYRLGRGISIALLGMVPERRHPIDSYMGYVVFKNCIPVSYAGSWILFDSARIGLNVFPSYRGGESLFIFKQVLKLHEKVYKLKRFSVDTYQLGKDNSDGIKSGAFWFWHRVGFRPIEKMQKELAQQEVEKLRSDKKYRSPDTSLKILAESRMELLLKKNPVSFDVNDLAVCYMNLLKKNYDGNRKLAEMNCFPKLCSILKILDASEPRLNFVLKNWCVLLLSMEKELRANKRLQQSLRKFFLAKAYGAEEEFIFGLQRSNDLKKIVVKIRSVYSIL